jgi:hypothetical protein
MPRKTQNIFRQRVAYAETGIFRAAATIVPTHALRIDSSSPSQAGEVERLRNFGVEGRRLTPSILSSKMMSGGERDIFGCQMAVLAMHCVKVRMA